MKIRCLGTIENTFVKEVFWFDEIWPPPSSKNDFIKIWTIGYGFRHVLRVPKVKAFEIKPHLWNNDDLWKKMDTLSTRSLPTPTILHQNWPWNAVLSVGT